MPGTNDVIATMIDKILHNLYQTTHNETGFVEDSITTYPGSETARIKGQEHTKEISFQRIQGKSCHSIRSLADMVGLVNQTQIFGVEELMAKVEPGIIKNEKIDTEVPLNKIPMRIEVAEQYGRSQWLASE
jgi:hypothetical protein